MIINFNRLSNVQLGAVDFFFLQITVFNTASLLIVGPKTME